MRLFVALDLPQTVKEQLALLCCGLPGARWERTEQLHLTLRFIGETDGTRRQEISEALAAVLCPPFSLQLKGVGFFPPRQEPHILWVGLEKSEPLLRLRQQIEAALKRIGVEPEGRKFMPHITLARLRGTSADKVGNWLVQHSLFTAPPVAVTAFRLYRSVLAPDGAKHFAEAEYPLAE